MEPLLAGQLAALVGLVAASAWGWKEIPDDARIRARAGTSGLDWTMSKTTALVTTPLVGLMVVAATAASGPAERDSLALVGLVLLVFLLLVHWSSVKRAAR